MASLEELQEQNRSLREQAAAIKQQQDSLKKLLLREAGLESDKEKQVQAKSDECVRLKSEKTRMEGELVKKKQVLEKKVKGMYVSERNGCETFSEFVSPP